MLDFPKWKVWAVWITIAVFCLCAIPSFAPSSVRANWPEWLPKPTVNLGLDLAGGSYILLEADTADLARVRLAAKRDEIETEFRRQDPRIDIGDISTRDGRITFMVRDATQVDAARERLLRLTGSGVGMTGQREWTIDVVDSTRFVVTQTQAGLSQAIDQAMGDAREVVDRRINALGTLEPTIVRQGTDRIVVQVPGLQDPEGLKALLGKTARLEFKLVDITASAVDIARGVAPIGSEIMPYPDAPPGLPYVAYPTQEGHQPQIALKRQVIVSGDQLINAQQEYEQQTNAPVVAFTFDSQGGRRFAQTTQANVNKPFAIIVDNQVISAPNINEPILGGRGQISGGFTVESANQLAIALRSGKMPVQLNVVEESTISPELGADSIEAGIIAGIIGTLAIVVLMIVAYFRFGIYANIALVVNVVMIIGVMALFNATLTLPGIAGFVLTIGAAVDANVLINERIREELKRGRPNNSAIEFGYKEASRAIFDANVTNVIAAAIMFIFGAGPVRGFAVVLTIGIVTSVFTAVTFTRLMVSNWLKTRPKTLVI